MSERSGSFMQDSSQDLAVDPASPDATVEDHFFKQGVDSEVHARFEAHAALDDWSKRTRRVRLAATGGITAVGLLAIGLLIWGGPDAEGPATVAVVSPASAAPPAPPAPIPVAAPAPVAAVAPVAAPPPPPAAVVPPAQAPAAPAVAAPVAAAPVAAAPVAAAGDDAAALEQSCRDAFGRKKYKDILDSCGRAFDARPTAADLAVLVAETELDRGRAASALTWARKAVAVDPNLADAYVFIGTAEQQAGHAQAARTAYLKYLELAPTGRYAQDLKAIVGNR